MDYSRVALQGFLEMMGAKGLAPNNTIGGLKAAVSRVLQDLSDQEEADVRRVDVESAIRRFNNKNPGALSPTSLGEYQRRITKAISEFVKYTEDPAGFRPRGRPSVKKDNGGAPKERKPLEGGETATSSDRSPAHSPAQPRLGLTLMYPIREDFLAQVVIPRDMTTDEAKRLSAFVQTLARDFKPNA